MSNLYEVLEGNFPRDRSRVFLQDLDGRKISYADLEGCSAAYANVLAAMGVAAGDRVAVQAEKSIEMMMLYLGCLRAGAVFLPLNTAYTESEVSYFLGDAEPTIFVCSPQRYDSYRPMAEDFRLETLGDDGTGTLATAAGQASRQFETIGRQGTDLAAILYTSGTTGRSKGAMLTHDNLASNCLALKELWRFTDTDVLLHALPIFHTHGLFVATNVTLAAGASLVFLPRFELDSVLTGLARSTVMMGVPTFYIRLLADERLSADATAHMRLFISGSAPLSADIHRQFASRTGHAILERYGMTETSMITSNPYDGERIPGTVGFPLPDVTVRIVDPVSGTSCPPGEIGVIEVAGPNVFAGYWQLPEKTAEEFHGPFFVTGDMGSIDDRGYVSIVGREKDLVISGGFNVYPAEVESALDELPGVSESAVIGVPHPDLGEAVVAVVVPSRSGPADEASLMAALSGTLARFKQPRRIVFLPELPKNAMGKVQKTVLRERYRGTFQPE